MEHAVLILLGFFVGLVGAVAGIGGGFFIMPYLLFVWSFDVEIAAATSLSVIFLNALSSSSRYLYKGLVKVKTGIVIVLFSLPLIVLGTFVVQRISQTIYYILFGSIMFLISIYVFISSGRDLSSKGLKSWFLLPLLGVTSGFVSSMFGIGGGVIVVPWLILIIGFAPINAIATSKFVLAFMTLAGSLLLFEYVQLNITLLMGIGAMIGAQIGVMVAGKLDKKILQRVVAVIMFLFGIQMLIKAVL